MTKNTGLKHKCGTLLDRDNVAGYVFILPFIIGLVVFTAIPFFTSLYLAYGMAWQSQNRAGNAHCAGRLAVRFFDADFSGGH